MGHRNKRDGYARLGLVPRSLSIVLLLVLLIYFTESGFRPEFRRLHDTAQPQQRHRITGTATETATAAAASSHRHESLEQRVVSNRNGTIIIRTSETTTTSV